MASMTQAQYAAYLAREFKQLASNGEGVSRESTLHDAILAECQRRQWIALHGRMDFATGRTVGEPDFTILADGGRVFLVEAKTATGKLSTEQAALHAWASKLGHSIAVVRNLQQFLELCR